MRCFVLLLGVLWVVLVRPLPAQAPAKMLRFEAAAIKPVADPNAPFAVEMSKSYLFNARGASLKNLVMWSYDLPDYQVGGGPDWFDKLYFDVTAKGEPPPPEDPNDVKVLEAAAERFRAMVRSLLEERFQLRFHREMKEMPVYNLVVARGGPKLKESTQFRSIYGGYGRLGGTGVGMSQLLRMLARPAGRPVLNRTPLDKAYDFELQYTPERPVSPGAVTPVPDKDTPSFFTAVQEQLGLRLEAGRGPMEVFVVDFAAMPSEN